MRFPGCSVVKNPPANARDAGDVGLISVGKISWRRKWQPVLVFLPGKLHGQKSFRLQSMGSQRVRHDLVTEQQ